MCKLLCQAAFSGYIISMLAGSIIGCITFVCSYNESAEGVKNLNVRNLSGPKYHISKTVYIKSGLKNLIIASTFMPETASCAFLLVEIFLKIFD